MLAPVTAAAAPSPAAAAHRRRERRRWLMLAAMLAVLALSFVFDIVTGPSMLPVSEVVQALLPWVQTDIATQAIVMQLRLPIALMALAVGASLGAGGIGMQTLLNNPMASPYTLGMAAAAGFGAALVLSIGDLGLPDTLAVPAGAFVMAMVAAAVLFGFAAAQRVSGETLILAGIALLFIFQSLLSLVQYLSSPELSQQILFWLFGSLTKATWQTLGVTVGVTAACCVLLLGDAWKLTALRLGETRARSLGVDVTRLRRKVLLLVALMTATATAFVGTIGFVGLVAPHMARLMLGEDQRFVLPGSMLAGAIMLSGASVLSKVIVPGALFPVGIVTALVGVPFFFWLLATARR